jgi:hypothetical protein
MIQREISVEDSIKRILSTPVGDRVMRPYYGSLLHNLIDAPLDSSWKVKFIAYAFSAIEKNEKRVKVKRVEVENIEPLTVTMEYEENGVIKTFTFSGMGV